MFCNHEWHYIVIVLLLPIQYSYQTDFYTRIKSILQDEFKSYQIPDIQYKIAQHIVSVLTPFTSIASIFIYYKIKKRRLLLSISFLLNSIVWFLYCAVNGERFWLLIFLRIFNSIFLGIFHTIAIFYIYHFSSQKYQSFYGYQIQAVMFLGLVIETFLLNFLNWRYVSLFLGIQCILSSLLIWILPDINVPPKSVTHDYIFNKQHRSSLLVVAAIMFLQQFSGVAIVINNVPRMLKEIGLEIDPNLQTAMMNSVGFLTSFITAFSTVMVQRKYLWAVSAFGLSVGLMVYALAVKVKSPKWTGAFGAFLFYVFYGFGEGPIPWMLCGELFPESVRVESAGLTLCLNRALGLAFSFVNAEVAEGCGELGSIVYSAVMDVVACVAGFLLIPRSAIHVYSENDNLM